jgi:hypothetical protein
MNEDAHRLLKGLSEFQIEIILVLDLNKFWARVNEPDHINTMERIELFLNNTSNQMLLVDPKTIHIGMLVASFHFSSKLECGFYRAKILKINWKMNTVEVKPNK